MTNDEIKAKARAALQSGDIKAYESLKHDLNEIIKDEAFDELDEYIRTLRRSTGFQNLLTKILTPEAKMTYLEDEWLSYRNEVIPKGAPEVQYNESKKAFYSGAYSIMNCFNGMSDLPEDEGAEILEDIYQEIMAFYNGIKDGN